MGSPLRRVIDGGESIEIPCGDGRGAQWVDNGKSIATVVARKKIGGKIVHKSFSMKNRPTTREITTGSDTRTLGSTWPFKNLNMTTPSKFW